MGIRRRVSDYIIGIYKLFLLMVCACVMFPSIAFGQQKQQEQLMSKLKNASQKEKVAIYNQLSRLSVYDDPEKAIHYADQALKIALSLKDKKGEAAAYNNMGMGYYFESDYERLLDFYKKSLTTYRSIGDNRSISTLSSIYFRLNQSEKALANYKRSLKLNLSEGDWQKAADSYRSMGDVYKNLAEYPLALENYRKAMELTNKLDAEKQREERARLLGLIGEVSFYQEAYDTALLYFQELQVLLEEIGDRQGVGVVLNSMANAYFFKGDNERAFDMYEQSLTIQKDQNDHYGAAMSLLNMGLIYSRKKQWTKALQMHRKSIRLAQVINTSDLLRDNYLYISRIYQEQKNFEKAYEYRILFSELSESMALEENVTQFVSSLALQELDQKKQENEILQAKNENYRLKLEKESLIRWRLSFGFTILIISILVFVIYYRYYLKREENQNLERRIKAALKKQEEQQQIITHQASLTSLGELAAGIAHEINQPIQNISLSAESIKIELIEEEPNAPYIKQSVDEVFEEIVRVREIVDHIRIFSSGQKEEIFEKFTVSDCVQSALSIIGRQFANHHIALELNLNDDNVFVLGNPHKLEQVVHNLLSNARDAVEDERLTKEGRCRKIEIFTTSMDKEVVLEVKDNGVGISEKRKTDIFLPFVTSKQLGKGTGLGLSISYSIVKEMGGRIDVESQEGEGTIMRITLPVYN